MKRKKQRMEILVGILLGVFGLVGPLNSFGVSGPASKGLRSGTVFAQGVTSAKPSSANSVPLINQPLVPDATAPGGPGFTLTVNGTGFVAASMVNWNGSARATSVRQQLTVDGGDSGFRHCGGQHGFGHRGESESRWRPVQRELFPGHHPNVFSFAQPIRLCHRLSAYLRDNSRLQWGRQTGPGRCKPEFQHGFHPAGKW